MNTQGVVAYEAYLEEICEKVEKDATVLAKQKARRAARITVLKKGVARAKSFVVRMHRGAANALDTRLSRS